MFYQLLMLIAHASGCVRYIFASLFCMAKREVLLKQEGMFFISL